MPANRFLPPSVENQTSCSPRRCKASSLGYWWLAYGFRPHFPPHPSSFTPPHRIPTTHSLLPSALRPRRWPPESRLPPPPPPPPPRPTASTSALVLEAGESDLLGVAVAVVAVAEGHGEGVLLAAAVGAVAKAAVKTTEAGHLELLAELGWNTAIEDLKGWMDGWIEGSKD